MGKVQPILGYPGLKTLQSTVDCEEDRGHVLQGHVVRITQTQESKGGKVTQKGNRLLVPIGVHVVLGPRETRWLYMSL